MIILAVDTSGGVCSAAVLKDTAIISECYTNGRRTHSETLGPMVDQCLRFAEVSVQDIELFACAAGPGSFTGIRIGAAFIKGLAHAADRPALGVNTLDALACNALGADALICPIIDARRDEVYTALYKDGDQISPYRAMPLGALLSELSGQKVLFLGDAALKLNDRILAYAAGFTIAYPGIALQRAASVGACAFKMHSSGIDQDAYTLEPVYLRETQAERVLAEKQGRPV